MKFLSSQVTYFLSQGESRQNIAALIKYLTFLLAVIAAFTVIFHLLMWYVEGRYFSWLSGLYWTLVVMSTLGFGDITFESDIGRLFSVIVLLAGVVLLLIMLPFTFIRFFYAPWLEAQIHALAPREVPEGTKGHVIICGWDSIAVNLVDRLDHNGIPYFVIESDPTAAARLRQDGISAVQGEVDGRLTFERLRVSDARLVFANLEDTTNTNITLTVREVAPAVPIAAIVADEDSVDILELSGATHVFPLKQRLGESLANRISVGETRANVIGSFDDWDVVEFTVQHTALEGKKIRETKIREETGVNIIGVWERGRLLTADPDHLLEEFSVPLGVGTKEQIESLEKRLVTVEPASRSVIILGGGKVGRAAALALKGKGLTVFMVEKEHGRCDPIAGCLDRLTVGDAADRDALIAGGLMESSLVILSTNDDAVNIYLSIYCRKLNPDVRIISRVTHERNIEAMHRAGADFVLSYAQLGVESVMSVIQSRTPIIMGEGVEFRLLDLPKGLEGKTLQQSEIGKRTGLIVLAIRRDGELIASPPPDTRLRRGTKLNVLGTVQQIKDFKRVFPKS